MKKRLPRASYVSKRTMLQKFDQLISIRKNRHIILVICGVVGIVTLVLLFLTISQYTGMLNNPKQSVDTLNGSNMTGLFDVEKNSPQTGELPSSAKATYQVEYRFGEIVFNPGDPAITIHIFTTAGLLKPGEQLMIRFIPDVRCEFGEGRACVYSFPSPSGKRVIFTSVHSGWEGEAESFRDFLEGTGAQGAINQMEQVHRNMDSLIGSEVTLQQGEKILRGCELAALVRIPPENFNTYMTLPVEDTLVFARGITGFDPNLFNQDLLVFETCGWKLPGEEQASGMDYTSSSLYLGFIRLPQD